MGYKKVCFLCKKAFSIYPNTSVAIEAKLVCPECGGNAVLFSHRFRPPRKNQQKEWELVEFLKDNGFVFQHVYQQVAKGIYKQIKYPETFEDAKVFVKTYKSQANPDYKLF